MDGRQDNSYGYPQNDGYQQNFQQNDQNGYNQSNQQMEYNQQGYAYGPNAYQQNTYQQNVGQQTVNVKKSYNNPFNRVGGYGLNLMVYMILASIMFMTGSTTALTLLFVAVFIIEKDNELNKVIATLLLEVFALALVQDVWYLVYSPIYNGLTGLKTNLDYYSNLYDVVEFLNKAVVFVNKTVTWLCSLLMVVVGIINFNNISKGKFKVPKIINKYFN